METTQIQEQPLSADYENNMIEAFVNKPTEPETILWYQNAFKKFNTNGVESIAWHWSWWGFFGGFLFLLYRKAYLAALGLFMLQIFFSFIPIPYISLVLWILTGGFSTYFVYKAYSDIKRKIEMVESDEEERIHLMRQLGGYNNWVIWIYGLFFLLTMLSIVAAVLLVPGAIGIQ